MVHTHMMDRHSETGSQPKGVGARHLILVFCAVDPECIDALWVHPTDQKTIASWIGDRIRGG